MEVSERMMLSPEEIGRLVDRAEEIAVEREPTLAILPRLERRRTLAWAVFRSRRYRIDR